LSRILSAGYSDLGTMKPALVARMNGQVDCGDFRWNVTP
jgi:hypothetical protein